MPSGLPPLVSFANKIISSDALPRISHGIVRREYSIGTIPYSNVRMLIGPTTLTLNLASTTTSPAG